MAKNQGGSQVTNQEFLRGDIKIHFLNQLLPEFRPHLGNEEEGSEQISG